MRTQLTKKEQYTYDYLVRWMQPLQGIYGYGFWNKSMDALGSYIGINARTARRHLQKIVRMGLFHRVDIIGYPSIYLDSQPDIEEVLSLCFYYNPVKEGYTGHSISMYGSDFKFFNITDTYSKCKPLEIDESEIPY